MCCLRAAVLLLRVTLRLLAHGLVRRWRLTGHFPILYNPHLRMCCLRAAVLLLRVTLRLLAPPLCRAPREAAQPGAASLALHR
jgi:hypothetical protein